MATAAQLTELLRAFVTREDEHFLRVAIQVAADQAQKGHTKVAAEMRDLIERARSQAASRTRSPAVPLAQPRGELAELLTVQYPKQHLSQMVLSPLVTHRVDRVLKEQRNHETLRGHGLKP